MPVLDKSKMREAWGGGGGGGGGSEEQVVVTKKDPPRLLRPILPGPDYDFKTFKVGELGLCISLVGQANWLREAFSSK